MVNISGQSIAAVGTGRRQILLPAGNEAHTNLAVFNLGPNPARIHLNRAGLGIGADADPAVFESTGAPIAPGGSVSILLGCPKGASHVAGWSEGGPTVLCLAIGQ